MIDLKVHEARMNLEELKTYLEQMIMINYYNGSLPTDIEMIKRKYKQLKMILKLERKLTSHKVKVINDDSMLRGIPKIYACTGNGRHVVNDAFSLTLEPTWMSMMEPNYHDDIETYLFRNHFISWYSNSDREAKCALLDRYVKMQQAGVSTICFPREDMNNGAKLNEEFDKIVVSAKSVVVPMAIEEYKVGANTISYVNIGKEFNFTRFDSKYGHDMGIIVESELTNLRNQLLEYVDSNGVDRDSTNISLDNRHLLMKL